MPAGGTVLVVCTGNVCRSPFIQLALAHRLAQLDPGSAVVVESGGTQALRGSAVAPAIAEALWERGIDGSNVRAKQVTLDQIDRAGLIIAASREHRTAVARMRPKALARLFTLRQVARLLQASEPPSSAPDLAAAVATHCARLRGTITPSAGTDDDLPDPWGREESAYRVAVDLMSPAVDVLAGALSQRHIAR